ncbi:unnamed protein product [Rotaria magnacalcarata]
MLNKESLYHRIPLISLVFILLLILLFFHSFGTSRQLSISFDVNRQLTTTTRTLINLKSSSVSSIQEPYIFSKKQYLNETRQPTENVIAFLVATPTGDMRLAYNPYPRLRERVIQLDERLGDNKTADIIIFHTGYPFHGDVTSILKASARNVLFVNVDHIFYKFSPGFDPHIRDPNWTQKGKWNYHHMCYFWFKQVFELKIIQQYRYMMRLDDDSGIEGRWPNVFEIIAKRQAVYIANRRVVDFEYVLLGITLVRNLTVAFMKKYNIRPRNPDMMADVFNHAIEIPNYWNNVEVIDLSLIRQTEVIDFMRWVDESRGIFLYRWGDAPLRYITLALFVNATQILHLHKLGLGYCHPC